MPKSFSASRRTFFKGAAVLGGSAVLLALGKEEKAAQRPVSQPPQPVTRGYRLTEHVARYYQTARG